MTHAGPAGAVSRPGGRPPSMPAELTVMNAVWCQMNKVIADRLTVATAAHASGRRIHRASRPRSSSARPHCATPNVTAAMVGGFRLEMAAPFTPTMLAGYPAQAMRAAVAQPPAASISAGPRRLRSAPNAQAMLRIPIGTVAWEETAFRSVLHAALRRVLAEPAATATAGVLFGVWHIRSTAEALSGNQVATGRNARIAAIAATMAATGAAGTLLSFLRHRSGSLAAPILLHLTANCAGPLASAVNSRLERRARHQTG